MELNEEFLREVGLAAMPEDERRAFLDYAQEELEVRIGEEIAKGVAPEKMKEFDEAETDEEALEWLEKNKPNFKEIVKKVSEELRGEISRNKEKILG
ncbi:hypothetical protein IJG21_03430 [Candidatus Saccharibacteria bacterium]|nr:hypothetical protein [Candidatus Saccharibacteria bacterium]